MALWLHLRLSFGTSVYVCVFWVLFMYHSQMCFHISFAFVCHRLLLEFFDRFSCKCDDIIPWMPFKCSFAHIYTYEIFYEISIISSCRFISIFALNLLSNHLGPLSICVNCSNSSIFFSRTDAYLRINENIPYMFDCYYSIYNCIASFRHNWINKHPTSKWGR